MGFQTDFRYSLRQEKAQYVWLKYRSILEDARILDVGADACYLREHLPETATYTGIGLGGSPDRVVDLEQQDIPFEDRSFDCVLCLDVLEHLDNVHHVFDELCRVSARHVIISLPNPWGDFYRTLCGFAAPGENPMKFYGLPPEPTEDRHKWFFSPEDAERFITYRAAKNGMRILQADHEAMAGEGTGKGALLRTLARAFLFRRDLNARNIYAGTIWAVIERDRPQGDR